MENGSILIRNLYWYRDCENKKIKDAFEGRTKYTVETKQESVVLSKEQANAITNDYHIDVALEIGSNSYFSDFLNVTNVFVFCTSLYKDIKLISNFDTDNCYKIADCMSSAKMRCSSKYLI